MLRLGKGVKPVPTREEILEKLAAKRRELGRDPTFSEVRDDPNGPSTSEIAYKFGSFEEALKELDAYHGPEENSSGKIAIKGKHPLKVMVKDEWLALVRGKKEAGMTREEMLERLIKIKQEKGEITDSNIKRDPVLVHYDVMQEFGSLEAAKKQVKLEVKKRRQERLAATQPAEEVKPAEDASPTVDAELTVDTDLPVEAKLKVPVEHEEFKAEMRKAFGFGKEEQSKPEKEGTKMVTHKRHARLTKEECLAELKQLAKELGHVPTRVEIREMGASEATMQRKLGPRCYWDELLGVPFVPKAQSAAIRLKAEAEDEDLMPKVEAKSPVVETKVDAPEETVTAVKVKKTKKATPAAEKTSATLDVTKLDDIDLAAVNVGQILLNIREMAAVASDLEVASEMEVMVGNNKTVVISICTK